MDYGHFSSDGTEFVIDRVDTPRPWLNYLYTRTGSYVSLLSANAGGYSYLTCPKDGRLTRWRYNSLPDDRPGRYIYLRNSRSKDYWTLSWQPTAKPVKNYKVTHGLGWTTFKCNYGGIDSTATYFVPLDDTLEIWNVTLKNTTGRKISLEAYPFAEMCLGHAGIDLTNKPDDQHFNRLWFDGDNNALFSTKTYWVTGGSANVQENKAWNHVGFMSASLPATAYAGEREVFFAPYRNENNPLAIETGKLQSSPVSSGNLVSCLKLEISLKPGEEKSFHIMLGAALKDEDGKWEANCFPKIAKYRDPDCVRKSLEEVKEYWKNFRSSVVVDTPSKKMNTFLNVWNQYQAKTTFINSRNASHYQWGLLRGMGFRDSLQDTIGAAIQEPDLVRKRILQIAGYQRSDGVCAHCFHPVSGVAEFTGHKDDPLWLVTATWFYLVETGDASILGDSAPFHDGKSATLLDHLNASVSFIEKNLGPNGIPTFGKGDWNDTLDFVGGADGMGESTWAGMFYAYNLRLFADIAEKILSDKALASGLMQKYEKVKNAMNSHSWDGDWYLRAISSSGEILGSSKCEEGKIYLNPQTWSVLAGVAGERGGRLMDTTLGRLDTDFGPKLLAPAYHKINKNIGLITRCVWGKKENGAIFNHTTTWTVMALSEVRKTERALALYEKLLPINFDQDRYQIEPYVYAQYTTSDEHETYGQGSHSWLSGTAAWMFRAAVDYVLGVRAGLDGIRLRPCIPSSWPKFSVTRKYRGTTYQIKVVNKGLAGKMEMKVDGKDYGTDNALPITPGKIINVDLTI